MTMTSHHFYNIIVRILEARLIEASALKDHRIILECFNPAAQYSTPFMLAKNLGIGTSNHIKSDAELLAGTAGPGALGRLREMYTHFRPHLRSGYQNNRMRHGQVNDPYNNLSETQTEYVCQNVHLESHELFSQLCAFISVSRKSPKDKTVLSCVNMVEGVMRIWRDWLAEQSAWLAKRSKSGSEEDAKDREGQQSDKSLLWIDWERHAGLRISVLERGDITAPVLDDPDWNAPVYYAIQYEGRFS